MLDLTTVPGLRAEERLRAEIVAWLTTVSPAGQPQSSPVWFLWDGASIVLRSLARAPRVRNIRAHPQVAFNLDSDGEGGDIVTFECEASIDADGFSASEAASYRSKYEVKVREYGWTWADFERDYPVVVRLRPSRVRLG